MICVPLLRKRAIHSSAVFSSGAPNSCEQLGGFPRQLLVGDADDAGPLQQRRRDDGRGIEHLQPLVLVVDHDARRQAVDRLLQEVARLSGRLPLPLMFHRGMADQQDQHQSGGDETCRTERQNKQRQPRSRRPACRSAHRRCSHPRNSRRSSVRAGRSPVPASRDRADDPAGRRHLISPASRSQYRCSVVADRVLPIAMGWHTSKPGRRPPSKPPRTAPMPCATRLPASDRLQPGRRSSGECHTSAAACSGRAPTDRSSCAGCSPPRSHAETMQRRPWKPHSTPGRPRRPPSPRRPLACRGQASPGRERTVSDRKTARTSVERLAPDRAAGP